MSQDGVKHLVLIGLLCLGGWGLMRVFSYLADPETNIFHRRRCHLVCSGGKRSRFTKKQHREGLVGFESRADAIEAGYFPCEECKP